MPKDITSYPFSQQELQLLNSKGFFHVEEIKELSISELSKELDVSNEIALSILHVVDNKTCDGEQHDDKTAFDLLQEEEEEVPIVTFCAELDNMIGGGIPISKITEFCGAPGAGKTQIGIQLAVDVQIPESFGGADGEAVYIDCEGSFISQRVVEIAQSAIEHLHHVGSDDDDLVEALKSCTLENVLQRIHVYRCHDYVQLIALSYTLPEFLIQHPNVKLIVLDSIAFHFRHDFEDMALRSRLLHGLVQTFMKIAHDNKLAVVFMNQMTTKLTENKNSELVPALGQVWGHACTLRIVLGKTNGQRFAHLLKSPSHQEARILFDITKDGIRDVNVSDTSDSNNMSGNDNVDKNDSINVLQVVPGENDVGNPSKRPRVGS